jgi:hypothetical protein
MVVNLKKEKSDVKVKMIIENYKKNLAKLMRRGQTNEVVSLLSDSGVISDKKTNNMMDIAKKSLSISCIEELEIQRVNFVFSLLTKTEKEIIANEFLFCEPSLWWIEKYSRSSYYRRKFKACKKFIEYYGNENGR